MNRHRKFNGPRLKPEIHELFVETVRRTGRINLACQRCGVSRPIADQWLAAGKRQRRGRLRDFADGVSQARGHYLVMVVATHHQLAPGGIFKYQVRDKSGNLVRDAFGNVQVVTKYIKPNLRALEWELERLEPTIYKLPKNRPEPSDKAPGVIEPSYTISTSPRATAVGYHITR